MITPHRNPAVAYLRRSTDRQEQSLADQRNEVTRWAREQGYEIIHEYVDDAISGTSADRRPGFQQMIADAQQGRFRAVIVWNSDRFSRGDVTETEHYRYLLRKAGVVLLSVTEDYIAREGIDGDVLRAVKQFQNRQFSINLSQNTLRGQVSSVLAASDPGRPAPYGYDREILAPDGSVLYRLRFCEGGDRQVYDRSGNLQATYTKGQMLKKPGKECRARLVLSDPARVQVVRDIFSMCLEGLGFKGIADELNRRGVMSPRGGLWNFTTIKALLENPVYRGDIAWNRRTESKFYQVRNGRVDKMKTTWEATKVVHTHEDDWLVIRDAVPPIVSRDEWDRAQLMVQRRGELKSGRGKQTNRWLLSGVLRCGECGQGYWGEKKRKGRIEGRTPVITNYYTCAGRRSYGKEVCRYSAHVKADDLEAWVLGRLRDFVFADARNTADAVDRFAQAVIGVGDASDTNAAAEQEIAKIDATIRAITMNIDPANLVLLNDRLTQLRQRKLHLERQARAATTSSRSLDEKAIRRWATEQISGLADAIDGRRDEKVRRVIAAYVEEVVIYPSKKTGYLAVNANLWPALNDNDRSFERSRASAIVWSKPSSNTLNPKRWHTSTFLENDGGDF